MIPSPPSRLDHAKHVLGKRLSECPRRGYLLDGRTPVTAFQVIALAEADVPRTIGQAAEDGI